MEQAVEKVFKKEIVTQALELFSLEKVTKKLGSFENYVFEVYRGYTPFILRITHSSHRSSEEILSELDWVQFLHQENVNVPEVFHSNNGSLVETLPAVDGTFFHVCLFSKAPGDPVRLQDENFNEKLFYSYGKTVGKMHRATMKYEVKEGVQRRLDWDEDDVFKLEKYIPSEEIQIYENAKKLLDQIKNLPKTKTTYGLIHTDLHSGNFFYDGEDIHTFDFDDSSYHYYCSDIAIPLYYSTLWKYPNESSEVRNAFAKAFLKAFMAGYETVHMPPPNWKEQLPLFLQLRDLSLYTVFNKKVPEEKRNESIKKMLTEIKDRLKQNIVPISVD